MKRQINKIIFPHLKFYEQKYLAYYIEKCSLLITDFSSISFDFMFQNKPVLFYYLDINDTTNFSEKEYMKIDYSNNIYYNNIICIRYERAFLWYKKSEGISLALKKHKKPIL
jgi:hypothetical protein